MAFAGLISAAQSAGIDSNEFNFKVDFCQTSEPIKNIEQAIGCHYDSAYNPLKLGFGESPRWLRIQISKLSPNKQLFAVQVRPFFLREVNFYSLNGGNWIAENAGSKNVSALHSEIGGHFFITAPTTQPQSTYYIQTDATSIASISVSVIAWPNSTLQPSGHIFGIGAQIGILATILVFSFVSLALNSSAVMARFTVYMANLILCLLAGSGIFALYLFKQSPLFNELIFFTGLCLKLGLWVWLAQSFLQDYQTPYWYKASCIGVYCLVFTAIALGCSGNMDLAILLILTGYTVTSVTQIVATLKTPYIERTLKLVLIFGFTVSIALIYLAIVSVFFSLEANSSIPLYLTRLTDFVNPLMMLAIIVYQNRLVRHELAKTKNALIEAQLSSQFESRLLKDRRTLIDMLTHELKNPLASIGLAIETLSQSINVNNFNDQRRLKNIHHSILNMDAIIERCNLMNLIDQGSLTLNLSKINLHDFLLSIVEVLQCEECTDLMVNKDLVINADPQFLQIVLNNLIENSLKYSVSGGRLKITALPHTLNAIPKITISIINRVSQDLIPNPDLIFKRFYRHPLAQKTRGSGLGLYICKELCSVMRGSIEYRFINDEVIFDIELPQ